MTTATAPHRTGLTRREKMVISIYRRAAKLAEYEWRTILYQATGCRSITAPALGDHQFGRLMCLLELRVAEAYGRGETELPRSIRSLTYWRNRVADDGRITSRQIHKINDLYNQLAAFVSVPDQADARTDYLCAVAAQAAPGSPRRRRLADLSSHQADLLLTALQSRLKQAIKPKERNA